MTKKRQLKTDILFFSLLIAGLVFCVIRFWPSQVSNPLADAYSISGWPYSEIQDSLTSSGLVLSSEGTIRIRIPKIQDKNTVLCFYLNEQSAGVYMGGQLIFSKKCLDHDAWCYVSLTPSDNERILFLNYSSTTAGTPGMLRSVYLGTREQCDRLIWKDMLPILLLCFSVLCFGLVFVVLGVYSREAVEAGTAIRHAGIMFLLLFVWGISNLPIMCQIFSDTTMLHYMGRICIMLVPLQLARIVVITLSDNKALCREINYFTLIFYLAFIGTILMDLLDICSLSVSSLWSRLLGVSFFAYLLIFGILDPTIIVRRRGRHSLNNTLGSLCVLAGAFYVSFEALFTLGSFMMVQPVVTWSLFGLCTGVGLVAFAFVLYHTRTLIDLQNTLAQSRVRLMLSQIKPHFMYNTLNSIRSLLHRDPETADQLVLQFSKYLRNNIRSIGSEDLVPFNQEIGIIESFVGVESVCHPNVQVKYEIEVRNFMIPPLSVQPLIENAIFHGVLKRPEGGTVILRTINAPGGIIIEVEDNGVGFSEKDLQGREGSYGLNNIRMRLEYLCHAKIDIFSAIDEGCSVRIFLPKKEKRGK